MLMPSLQRAQPGSRPRAPVSGGRPSERSCGWIFGYRINGVQAEYARVPFADNSVYKIPDELTDEQVLFLADILPTSYEVGVLNGHISPGDVRRLAVSTAHTPGLHSHAV